jgi:hypothetical protein
MALVRDDSLKLETLTAGEVAEDAVLEGIR